MNGTQPTLDDFSPGQSVESYSRWVAKQVCPVCNRPIAEEAGDWTWHGNGDDGAIFHASCCPECSRVEAGPTNLEVGRRIPASAPILERG